MENSNPIEQAAASVTNETRGEAFKDMSYEVLLCEYATSGSEKAFEQLFACLGQRLFNYVCRYIGNQTRAEDVYQAVLVKIATRATGFSGNKSAVAWIFKIARNSCVDELRQEARRPKVSIDREKGESGFVIIDALASSEPGPDKRIEEQELTAAIVKAVETLPDEQREAFLLKEESALTFAQVGDILGCGKETAKSRVRYALERLRNALGKEARNYGL